MDKSKSLDISKSKSLDLSKSSKSLDISKDLDISLGISFSRNLAPMFPYLSSIKSDSGSSASLSSKQLPKVCIITGALVGGYPGHHLYIVDLNSSGEDGGVYLAAKVRDDSSALCVIGYRVYVFEAEDVDEFKAGDRKHVYSYKLSSSDRAMVRLQVKNRKDVCVMKATKFCPCAIASPDGSKIVVYASMIRPLYKKKRLERCDFELFDVRKKACKKLPQLWPRKRREESSIMASAGFKAGSSSELLVLVENRVYSLDLKKLDDGWKALSSVFENSVPMGMGSPLDVIGDNICLTPYGAYHLGKPPGRSFTYPDLSKRQTSGPLYPILLDHTSFCTLHAGLEQQDYFSAIPHYVIDVYNCDLKKLSQHLDQISKKNKEEEEEPLPGTTKLKSLRFSLEKGDAFLLGKCRFASIPNPPLKAKTT